MSGHCEAENCPRPVQARGFCNTHYARWHRKGDISDTGSVISQRENSRAWALVSTPQALEPGPCWIWPGSTTSWGYGISRRNGEKLAHRSAWVAVHGPIPEGLIVCHVCDTPRCFRPSHLFLGTHADNTADKMRKGRMFIADGRLDRRVGLTDEEALAIRCSNEPTSVLQRKYGVTGTHIRSIRSGTRRAAPTGVTPGRPRRQHAAHERDDRQETK